MRRVYAHPGTIRHRSEVVEYRVEQHRERLGDRLERLGLVGPSGTGKDTAAAAGPEEEVLAVHEERFDQIGRLRRGGAI